MTRRTPAGPRGRRDREPAAKLPDPAAPRLGAETSSGFSWPGLRELLDWREPWLFPALALVVIRLLMGRYIPFAAEDAYITFRYARNLASGSGLVFNPGERVFGFSSPLWTVWTALGTLLGAPPVTWTRSTTIALELATLLVVVALIKRQAGRVSAWCFAFFWVAWPYFSAVSISGMENLALIGFAALATAACARGSLWSGPALAAVALMRPEGLAMAAVLAVLARWRDRAIGAALVIAGVAALALYFGSPIPQSVVAKSMVYGTPGPMAGRHWWEWLVPFVFGRFPNVSDPGHLFLLVLVFAPAAVLGARALWPQRRSPLAALIAACLVVWLGYATVGVAYFWWYLSVPLAGFAALAAVGFPRLARGPALSISTGLLTVGLWTVVPALYLGRAQSEYLGFGGVANFLASQARVGEKVMLEPIGMVGYAAPLVVVDEVGLVSPRVARRRMGGPGWYTDIVAAEAPQWLVLRRGVLTSGRAFAGAGALFRDLAERDSLLSRYGVVAAIDTVSGDNSLMVLRRR